MWKILLLAFLWKICNHLTVGGKWIATEILQSPIGILQHSFIVHAMMRLSSICKEYLEPAWTLSLPMVLNLYCRWVKFGGGGMNRNCLISHHASMMIQPKLNILQNMVLPCRNMPMSGPQIMIMQL